LHLLVCAFTCNSKGFLPNKALSSKTDTQHAVNHRMNPRRWFVST